MNIPHQSSKTITYTGFLPGALSSLCALQSEFYSRVWGFDQHYESVIAKSVGEFLSRFDTEKDFIQIVHYQNKITGGITIDHRDGKIAQLRWFILSDELRGLGVGNQLINEAMQFINQKKFDQVFLTTFEGLDGARYLYEKNGFKLSEEKMASNWGKEVKEQRFDWYSGNHKLDTKI